MKKPFAVLIATGMLVAAGGSTRATGPTKESALEAETAIGAAMRNNDPDALCRLLDPDWAIVTGLGGVEIGAPDDGKVRDDICAAVKSGVFTRSTYDIDFANARVRLYGDVATITFKLSAAGALRGKKWHGNEVVTDVLKWENGSWKSVLTHETNVQGTVVTE